MSNITDKITHGKECSDIILLILYTNIAAFIICLTLLLYQKCLEKKQEGKYRYLLNEVKDLNSYRFKHGEQNNLIQGKIKELENNQYKFEERTNCLSRDVTFLDNNFRNQGYDITVLQGEITSLTNYRNTHDYEIQICQKKNSELEILCRNLEKDTEILKCKLKNLESYRRDHEQETNVLQKKVKDLENLCCYHETETELWKEKVKNLENHRLNHELQTNSLQEKVKDLETVRRNHDIEINTWQKKVSDLEQYRCSHEKETNIIQEQNVYLKNCSRNHEQDIIKLQENVKVFETLGVDHEEKLDFLLNRKDKSTLCFESEKIWRSLIQYDREELDDAYCAVTFSDTLLVDQVNKITQDCYEGRKKEKNLRKIDVIIQEAKDVLKIPPARVCLIFIRKNEENLILETPGRSTTDLRLLVVKSCRKMIADVFVVYFGDRDSESLMPGLLYNPQIAAVTEHSELKELEKLDKVITCYNKLTITQREKIAEFIV